MLNFRRKANIILFNFLFSFGTNAYADFFDDSTLALEERIAPIGKVKATSSETNPPLVITSNKDSHLGKTIFESKCIFCHGHGIAGAPRLGNKTDWAPRVRKKFPLLLKHAITGYRAMPPKGACLECSVTDLETTINYMLKQLCN